MGSSPRMRGARVPVQHLRARVGIIPAYAGSTACAATSGTRAWDHPRVCGEHRILLDEAIIDKGSSPRMRGAPHRVVVVGERGGIIPAYAGSTRHAIADYHQLWDHPRVCGEHLMMTRSSRVTGGSSPRMRGALDDDIGHRKRAGIIPAYAGSTYCRRRG